MALITRCPACETAFRVHQHQLAARDGRVRCGRCAVVFDAREALVAETPEAPEAPAPRRRTAAEPPAEDVREALDEPIAPLEPTTPTGTPDEARDAASLASPRSVPGTRPEGPPSAPLGQPPADEGWRAVRGAATLPPATGGAETADENEDEYGFGPQRRRRARTAAILWGAATLVLAVVLALQATYQFRGDLAARVPELRGWFDRACETLGCDVPLPARSSMITIEASEMQPHADAQGVLQLSAILRNRATSAQRQPWLELTLTDAQDRAVARRVLAPRDYLGPRAEPETAFPAGAERSLRLLLDVDTLPARGYRLLVFYP
ncbi:MAG: zinc-ribbon domain-containing protein [Burkholderiales bacterium]|nr:zinc-ribbon domain-containing protein [Burkholderiales bacterium]